MRKIHRVLSLILDMAVKDGRMSRNVATGVNLPRPVREEQRHLGYAQVDALAEAVGRPSGVSKHRRLDERENETYRLAVLLLAYTVFGSARWPRSGCDASTSRAGGR